jgi:2'-5' RNA ligase
VPASAVVVLFETLEPHVSRWRRAHTKDGADGMPAHVTLIYPFVDDTEIGGTLDGLLDALARFEPFEVTFASFGRFDGPPPVLYLEPSSPERFRAMIRAIASRFPAYPPFEGVYADIVPHLTVTHTDDEHAPVEAQRAIDLPLSAAVETVAIMQHTETEGWQRHSQIAL